LTHPASRRDNTAAPTQPDANHFFIQRSPDPPAPRRPRGFSWRTIHHCVCMSRLREECVKCRQLFYV
jgi:hypothetical protein